MQPTVHTYCRKKGAGKKLEVADVVTATSFTGKGIDLTNLAGVNTATISNMGSNSIGEDNESDTNGSNIFQTNQNTKVRIESDGFEITEQ